MLAVLAASVGAASASAYECYTGSPDCNAKGPLQHLVTPEGTSGVYYMSKTTTSFVYWQPKGAPAFPKGYKTAVTDFFKGLETENGSDQNFFSVLAQYGLHETHFGKAIKDKDPYPAESSGCDLSAEAPPTRPCVSQPQVETEVKELVNKGKLPKQLNASGQVEITNIFFVMLPPGVSVCDYSRVEGGVDHASNGCSGKQYCAFHNYIFDPSEEADDSVYAVMPYMPATIKGCDSPQHPNGVYEDEFPAIEHEFAESATNPYGLGWFNRNTEEDEEVADICSDGHWGFGNIPFDEKIAYGTALGTAPNGALYNQVIDGRYYYLQQLYSNATETCVQRKALPPVVSKLAPSTGSTSGDTSVTITGLNFQNPTATSVTFGKTAAKSFTVNSPTSITAVSPAVTAVGAVAVTVTTTAGTSASVPADEFTYEAK